jgi:predicted tellurium resistance membrane protein TerC
MPSATTIVEVLPIIFSLIVIEGLISVDNALAIAARVSRSMAGETPALQ